MAANASPLIVPLEGVETSIDARTSGAPLRELDWSVRSRVLRGGVSDGVQVIDLSSGPLEVSLLPTRGMGIWKAVCDKVPVGWDSPVKQPVHPAFVNLEARNGLGWLDGFNELLCRCGLSFNGPPEIDAGAKSPIESRVTLHGRVANTPADSVSARVEADGRISVTGVVHESTMFGPQFKLTSTVSLQVGGRSIEIEDRIENLASTPAELELLYHINVGPPFLEGGSRVIVPASEVAPRDPRAADGIDSLEIYLPPTAGYAEQVYFYRPLLNADGRASALLRNAGGDRGFAVAFDPEELPCFTVWKCTQPLADGYVTGLEPATNFPNPKSFERRRGRVIALPPGESRSFRVAIDLLISSSAVAAREQELTALQSRSTAKVHRAPARGFSVE